MKINHRIYYYETDQMGVVYHSNYLKWLEIGRTEFLRNIIPYSELEQMGIIMPVKTLNIEYINSVKYDDLITIDITVSALTKVKVQFEYKIYDQNDVLKAAASTINVMTNRDGKITKLPDEIYELIRNNI